MPRRKKWEVLKSKEVVGTSFFSLKVDQCRLPDQRIMPRYYTIEFSDWVHVVPMTKKNEVVLVEQYRHAARKSFVELPGGGVHFYSKFKTQTQKKRFKSSKRSQSSHERLEPPRKAARRELLEETGFISKNMKKIGVHYPNPALQSNKIHVFLALECEKVREPQLDPFEDITVKLWSFAKLLKHVQDVKIKHSLMIPSVLMALRAL